MNITEEAIEAAGEHLPPVWTSNPVYRAELTAALAAAMPFMLAANPLEERNVDAEQFLASYAERSEMTREQVLDGHVVATCHCDYQGCEGFQINTEDNLLPWRDETVLIRT